MEAKLEFQSRAKLTTCLLFGICTRTTLLKLSSKVDDFVGEKKGINKQLSLRMDSMEKSQHDMENKMDNM